MVKKRFLMVRSVRIGDFSFPKESQMYRKSLELVRADLNSKMAVNNFKCAALAYSIRIFRLEILNYLSRRSLILAIFRSVEPKLSHHLHSDRNFGILG